MGQVLVVSELMYHPPGRDALESRELEFLELHNRGDLTLDLSGYAFTEGIDFAFAEGSSLAAGEYLVLVSSTAAFASVYAEVSPFGEYEGQLANSGETVGLVDGLGRQVARLSFGDKSPWPVTPDGFGPSLVLKDESLSEIAWTDPAAWRASSRIGGSPGGPDAALEEPAIVVNEVLSHTDLPQVDAVELRNLESEAVDISGWYLTDNYEQPKRYRIPEGAVIEAGGYLVITEEAFAAFSQGENAFRLDSHGEAVWIFSGDEQGELSGYVHGFEFGATANGVSLGRFVDSGGVERLVALESLSLGEPNGEALLGDIVISELMFDPASGEAEFVEIVNRSGDAVSLFDEANPSNVWKVQGIDFSFPPGVVLAADEVAILCGVEPELFRERYGLPDSIQVFGPFAGKLSNEGERLALQRPDSPDLLENGELYVPYVDVDWLMYSDAAPWPAAMSEGFSIERLTLDAKGFDPASWRLSQYPSPTAGWVPTGVFEKWIQTHFPGNQANEHDAQPLADPDQDGLVNLLEYAHGSDPRRANLPLPATIAVSQATQLAFAGSSDPSDLKVHLLVSYDLQSWDVLPESAYAISESLSPKDEGVKLIRFALGETPGESRFYRMAIELMTTD
ncbi:lamin tail domain-containing protein [Pelagicoccus sp. SDUM812003]|nr:lamin tail domain-containing protein [Pelagicoccus sp. SDUM812003]